MELEEMQPVLVAVVAALPSVVAFHANVHVDDGNQRRTMDRDLVDNGLTVLVMRPACVEVFDQSKKAVVLVYSCTVWVRVNPSVLGLDNKQKFNSLVIEKQLIPAVIKRETKMGEQPFMIPVGLEPEQDLNDQGNDSRLIRFGMKITF